jgi:hypothetical protein
LAAAYRAGDMSLAYPVARSLPVVLTTLAVALASGAGSFSALYVMGCALVISGIILVPAGMRGGASLRTRLCSACTGLALLAAAGTTGYSIIDSGALAALRGEAGFTATEAALFYLAAEAVTSTAWMAAYVLARRGERRELASGIRGAWRPATVMGLGIYGTYALVLVAMAFARNVGYIVAFRQLSIPLGSVLAMVVFREPAPATRVAGVAATTVGLLLIALG